MTQFASATFNGTATTELSALDSNWVKHPTSGSGITQVASDGARLRHGSDVNEARYYHSASPSSADYSVSADIIKVGSGGGSPAVCGRMSTTQSDYYYARYSSSSGGWQLYVSRAAGTVVTQLGSTYTQTLTVGQAYRLTLDMVGSTIRLLVDGVQRVTATEANLTAAGKAGLRDSNTAGSDTNYYMLDNFSADEAGGGDTITANLGTATAAGFAAAIAVSVTIACSLGGASASGNQASISTGSNVTINCAVGTATASGHSATVTSSGSATITTDVFKNNTGTVLASTLIPKLVALKLSDMTLAASWTNQTTNGSGVLSLTGAMAAATDYLLVVSSTDGASVGVKKYTAA